MIANLIAKVAGMRNTRITDFMPHYKKVEEDEDEGDATLEDVMRILGGAVRPR